VTRGREKGCNQWVEEKFRDQRKREMSVGDLKKKREGENRFNVKPDWGKTRLKRKEGWEGRTGRRSPIAKGKNIVGGGRDENAQKKKREKIEDRAQQSGLGLGKI